MYARVLTAKSVHSALFYTRQERHKWSQELKGGWTAIAYSPLCGLKLHKICVCLFSEVGLYTFPILDQSGDDKIGEVILY